MGKGLAADFWENVAVLMPSECWLWTGGVRGGKPGYPPYGGYRNQYAHRVAYSHLVGPIPAGQGLDHRPECPKLCVNPHHLRPATQAQNMQNLSGAHRDSRSGVRGVNWESRTGKWRATVCFNRVNYRLGRFSTIEEAEAVVLAKRLELFTHNDQDRRLNKREVTT